MSAIHRLMVIDPYFLEYNPSSCNITRCQVPSRVRAWIHNSASDIDFYQISLSQSESTILHESIIYANVKANRSYGMDTKSCQTPYKFDLEVKGQCRIVIINVRDTLSYVGQIWFANVKAKRS